MSDLPPLRIEGQDLARTSVRLPEDLPAGPGILLFAFAPTHQSQAMSWADSLSDIVTSGIATARQVIVLPAFAKLGERLVFDQLIKTVPTEAHPFTIVAFTDPGGIAKATGAPGTGSVIVALLDNARSVAWTTSGAHTPELEAALRASIAQV